MLKRKINTFVADIFIESLINLPNTTFIKPYYSYNLIENDPDDNKYIDCYLASNSVYLITNDKHFDIFNSIPFPTLNILRLNEFALLLTQQTANSA